jgi:ABC-type phosphate transport system ATPase subunit
MNATYAVDLESVWRIYRRDEFEVRALDNVTMKIASGRFVAMMGPSRLGQDDPPESDRGHRSSHFGPSRRRR